MKDKLFYTCTAYEDDEVWFFKLTSDRKYGDAPTDEPFNDTYNKELVSHVRNDKEYYGIHIAQTWNSIIDLSNKKVLKRIEEAKKFFKEITGQ